MLKKIFPILNWLPNYKKEWIKGDISAGITVGVILIPQGIAYAMVAGLPPIYGLYTAMIPQIVYAFFGTAKKLAVGPVATDSLIVGAGILTLADIGTENFIEFAILLAFLIGVLQLLFGLFKLGFLVNFLSKPVISGFTSAAALLIAISQFTHLLGISLKRSSQIQDIVYEIFLHLKEMHFYTFLLGFSTIIIIYFLKKYFKKLPAALVVVILGIIVAKIFNFESHGIKLVGEIPSGLPYFKMPNFSIEILKKLFPIALTLAFIGFLEAISIGKASELKDPNSKIIPNKELIALGLGNLVGSFFQTYPATAGFSRTAVSEQAGAQTPLYGIIAAIVVGITLMYLTPLFYFLPNAVIGAIIFVAVIGLIDFKIPSKLWVYSKQEFFILNFTLIITAVIGIKEGILFGVFLSIAKLVYKSSKPHIAILGNVPGTHFYRHSGRFKEVEIDEKILIIRFDAQIHFANASFFKEKIQEFAKAKGDKLKLIIINGESLNKVDSTAILTLYEIIDYFNEKNIDIYFASLKGPVRDTFKISGLTEKLGLEKCFMSVQDAVDSYNKKTENKKHLKFISQTNK